MGCGYSQGFVQLSQKPQYQEWNKTFIALQISKAEVYKLYKKFQKVDLDGGGTIDVVELLTVIDVERTPFTERVFSIFDDDKSGKIDFYEFVLSLWNYCTLSRVTLAMFAFDLYDRDSSGFLEEKDIYLMLKDIYGKDTNGHYAKQTRKDLEEFIEQKGDINLDRFLVFVQNHHSLLFPAFQMQLALKQNILGVRFWEKASDRRVRLSQKKYVTIKEILEMQAIQAKADSMKGLLVSTNTGKLAIRSIGTAHDRRTKYDSDDPNRSNDSQDGTITNTADNSHGNSHQSLASPLPNHSAAVHPETVGTISTKFITSSKVHARSSIKSSTKGNSDMLDALMNPHTSTKRGPPTSSDHHDASAFASHPLSSVKEEGHKHHSSTKDHHDHRRGSTKDHHIAGSTKDSNKGGGLNRSVPTSPRVKSPPSPLPPTQEEKTPAKEEADLAVQAKTKTKGLNNAATNVVAANRVGLRRRSV